MSATREAILSITVRLQAPDGAERVIQITPEDQYDALFWSVDAIQKFALPFYDAPGRAEDLEVVREGLLGEERGKFVIPLAHKRTCKPEWLGIDAGDPQPYEGMEISKTGGVGR